MGRFRQNDGLPLFLGVRVAEQLRGHDFELNRQEGRVVALAVLDDGRAADLHRLQGVDLGAAGGGAVVFLPAGDGLGVDGLLDAVLVGIRNDRRFLGKARVLIRCIHRALLKGTVDVSVETTHRTTWTDRSILHIFSAQSNRLAGCGFCEEGKAKKKATLVGSLQVPEAGLGRGGDLVAEHRLGEDFEFVGQAGKRVARVVLDDGGQADLLGVEAVHFGAVGGFAGVLGPAA